VLSKVLSRVLSRVLGCGAERSGVARVARDVYNGR